VRPTDYARGLPRDDRPTVLILGGTTEARELADALVADGDVRAVTSLAGRTRDPRPVAGEVRVGAFGCSAAMARWLAAEGAAVVVDATHPFAHAVSVEARAAARRAGVPLVRLVRPGWTPGPGDAWHHVDDVAAAAALLPAVGRRAFLAVGRQELGAFARLDGVWCLVRSIERPDGPLPARHELLLDRGPYDRDGETALLREHRIEVVVTKDSGGDGTRAKLDAARDLGIPVIVVRRPSTATGGEPTVATARERIRSVLARS
jgi:precorrin-6A/cobalt-precorrin-6A reductase